MLFGEPASASLPRPVVTALLLVSVAGLVSLARSNRLGTLLLLAPPALAVCASRAQLWPLTPRLLLFAAPAVIVTVSAGLAAAARLAPPRARAGVLAFLALIVISGAAMGAVSVVDEPPRSEPMPAAMAYVREHHGKDATVYVAAYLEAACVYYSAWHPDRERIGGDPAVGWCAIKGARMVFGGWPVPTSGDGSRAADATPPVSAEWVAKESARLLAAATGELWLILIDGPKGSGEVVPEIERAGAVRVAERRWGSVIAREYRCRPSLGVD